MKTMNTKEPPPSAAIQFLQVLWDHRQEETGHSWLRLNQSMRSGLMLAVEMGLHFDEGDLSKCHNLFRAGYWFGDNIEDFYRRAVLYGNASAWKCYEHYADRVPFIWLKARARHHNYDGGRMGESLARLVEGANFIWEGESVTVTSFNDQADPKYFNACSYKVEDTEQHCDTCGNRVSGYRNEKISKRYRITHADLKDAKAAIRKAKKAAASL